LTQLENDSFLRACWRKEAEFTPVWFMRQAGRYLESYRRVRAKNDVLTICKTPELVAKVTVAAVDELGVDAAILFADIMLPLDALGVKLDLVDGTGPVIENPVTTMEDLEKLKGFSPKDHVPYVLDSVRAVKQALDESPAHRLFRRALHPCFLPDRGQSIEGFCEDEDDDVQPA